MRSSCARTHNVHDITSWALYLPGQINKCQRGCEDEPKFRGWQITKTVKRMSFWFFSSSSVTLMPLTAITNVFLIICSCERCDWRQNVQRRQTQKRSIKSALKSWKAWKCCALRNECTERRKGSKQLNCDWSQKLKDLSRNPLVKTAAVQRSIRIQSTTTFTSMSLQSVCCRWGCDEIWFNAEF